MNKKDHKALCGAWEELEAAAASFILSFTAYADSVAICFNPLTNSDIQYRAMAGENMGNTAEAVKASLLQFTKAHEHCGQLLGLLKQEKR